MQSPVISVILCTYNNGLFLAEAIQSILDQTFTDFEFIIVNDGSTDDTKTIVQKFASPKIRYFEHPENRGQEDAKNLGLAKARGKYVAYMDGDDISKPNRLQLQFEFLETHSNIGVCSTGVQFFGKKADIYFGAERNEDIRFRSLFSTSLTHATCMIRRSILEEHNLRYHHGYLAAEDFLFLSNLLEKTKAYCIQKPLYLYRWHNNNISVSRVKLQLANFNKISRANFEKWLAMDLTEKEHAIICAFFRGPNELTSLPVVDRLLKQKFYLEKAGDFGKSFRKFYGKRLLDVYIQEGGKGLLNLRSFLRSGVWRYLPFGTYFLKYALIISRSIYRSIINEPRI